MTHTPDEQRIIDAEHLRMLRIAYLISAGISAFMALFGLLYVFVGEMIQADPDFMNEPEDARFAALVCSYAQWLAGDQPGFIDAELVAALARETASATLPEDRAKFLMLVDRSLRP